MIAVIDYGMGNIHSVKKALELFGAEVKVTHNPKEILQAQKVVLPGVGAFDDAMAELERQMLIPVITKAVGAKKPFLGICLGMQLLFEKSQEAKNSKGLGIIKGEVKKFSSPGLKVPHMGWNQIKSKVKCPLLEDVADEAYVYFCHSYYPAPKGKDVVAATCDYGIEFCAAVQQDNVFGVQFHPEKSQLTGKKIIENFVKL